MSITVGTLGSKRVLDGLAKKILSVDTYDQFVSVCDMVGLAFGVNQIDLFGNMRCRNLVTARRVIWWLLRFSGWSFSRIGRRFNRDHSSVLVGIKIIENKMLGAGSIYSGLLPALGR